MRESVVERRWRRCATWIRWVMHQPPTYPRRLPVDSIPNDLLVINVADPDALTHLLDLPNLAVTRLERPAWLGRHILQCAVTTGRHRTLRYGNRDLARCSWRSDRLLL